MELDEPSGQAVSTSRGKSGKGGSGGVGSGVLAEGRQLPVGDRSI